jgi:hypothetical protein
MLEAAVLKLKSFQRACISYKEMEILIDENRAVKDLFLPFL